MEEQEPLRWLFKLHNDHTEVLSSEEYASRLESILMEARVMYPFQGDSMEYRIIRDAARNVADLPGLFCEIGFRAGAGLRFMMEAIHDNKHNRTLIAIDPYGNIPYEGYDLNGEVVVEPVTQYSNQMMKTSVELMYRYVACYPYLHFLFFPMEDSEFFKRFEDGVPVYTEGKKEIVNQYALVHFDGPHTFHIVKDEVDFFLPRTPIGAMFVFDDIYHFYDHDKIEEYLFENGWELIEKGKAKASYMKV